MDNTRKILMFKDIKSNIIEEAIFVLRDNRQPSGESNGSKHVEVPRDILLKEAEEVINSYIKSVEEIKNKDLSQMKNPKKPKKILKHSVIVNTICGVSFLILALVLLGIFLR